MSRRVLPSRPEAIRRDGAYRMFTVAASAGGQVMVLICVSLIAIMGMIAVVTDFSFMQHQRNMMQTAADSAAMAGSEELNYGDMVAAGKADAASNGYTDGQSSVTVTINNPPSSGPNASNTAYVEAIVSKPQPTYFLRVLGVTAMTVSTRAVAYAGNGPNCIYVMNPSASGAMSINGNVTVNSSCGLLVDSSSSSGLTVNGNTSITATNIGVVGGYTSNGNTSFSPTPKTGVIAASDPLAYVNAPTVGSCAHTNFSLNGNNGSSGSPYQLYAGTYCGGISVNGNSVLRFNGGTYVLAGGGMNINGNSTMTGTGSHLLQHNRDRWLRGNHVERQLAGEFQRAYVGFACGNSVLSGSRGFERLGQHDKRQFEFDVRWSDLLRNDYRYVQRKQQRQRLQHRGSEPVGAQRQLEARQQLYLADQRITD